jgi:hypothetical protein
MDAGYVTEDITTGIFRKARSTAAVGRWLVKYIRK